jgi:hypothetical protein
MKKIYCMLIGVVLLLMAGHAGAETKFTQNEFITAESLDQGKTQTGVHFTLGDDFKSYYPAIRYGLGGLFEVGAKFGVVTDIKPDNKNGALVGADLKYQLIKQTEGIPVDMAVDLGYDSTILTKNDGKKIVNELKFSTVFSRGFPLTDRGYKFTPYGGLQVSLLSGSYLSNNDTNYYVFGGLEWKISQQFMAMLEVKAGATTLGGLGLRFEF